MSNASGRRKVITRNFTSDSKFSASKFPRSGFDLSYQSKDTGMIGRIWLSGYQHLQPKDSFSGGTAGSVTFNKLVTPVAPELHQHTYVFQTRHRSVDADYMETMNPNELNNFGATSGFPMFSVCDCANKFAGFCTDAIGFQTQEPLADLYAIYRDKDSAAWTAWLAAEAISASNYSSWRQSVFNSVWSLISNDMEAAFRADYENDLREYTLSLLPETFAEFSASYEGAYAALRALLVMPVMFFGQGSWIDQFGYPCISLYPIHVRSVDVSITTDGEFVQCLFFGGKRWLTITSGASTDTLKTNEYPLRHLVSIWIEYLRNVHLEKRASWMKYRYWTNTSFMNKLSSAASWTAIAAADRAVICAMLAPLSTYYAEDLVTSAQVDAAFKHVYAPIVGSMYNSSTPASPQENGGYSASQVAKYAQVISPASTASTGVSLQHNSMTAANIQYEQPDGSVTNITCPIPANVNNFLQQAYGTKVQYSLIQDFGVVRTMHNVENYLKRKWYFGDEYQDEMKAQHDVDLSDTSLLKPKLIAGGVQLITDQQMVASNGGDPSDDSTYGQAQIGTRVAKQEGNMPNVNYSGFADEFGMIIQLSWILPTAHYNPACVQNYAKGYLDMPLPVMASSNESIINNIDFSRTQNKVVPFGHGQSYSHWRTRLNEAHGEFLDSKCDWYMTRWFSSTDSNTPAPILNYKMLRCSGLQLGMYQDSILFDNQFWVLHTNVFHVMRQLPSNVEYC